MLIGRVCGVMILMHLLILLTAGKLSTGIPIFFIQLCSLPSFLSFGFVMFLTFGGILTIIPANPINSWSKNWTSQIFDNALTMIIRSFQI